MGVKRVSRSLSPRSFKPQLSFSTFGAGDELTVDWTIITKINGNRTAGQCDSEGRAEHSALPSVSQNLNPRPAV